MKILVATAEGQGERADDFFETEEGEIVVPAMTCDRLHEGCMCSRVMVGVRTGKETTTAIVVESDMTRAAYTRALADGVPGRTLSELGLGAQAEHLIGPQAGDLLRLAAELPAGVVIERDGDDFNPRRAAAVAEC
jgi:hypothetical protein